MHNRASGHHGMQHFRHITALVFFVFATLYMAAGLTAGWGSVQIISMAELNHTDSGKIFHLAYTAFLLAAAIGAFTTAKTRSRFLSGVNFFIALLILAATGGPILQAVTQGASSGFYEHCIGELLTMACAVCLIIVSIPRSPMPGSQAGPIPFCGTDSP